MRRQRGGVEIVLVAVVAGLVLSIGALAVHTYTAALERAQRAEDEAETQRQAATDQRTENARLTAQAAITDRISATRKTADLKKADLERMVADALQKIYASSPAAVAWRDTPVPLDVLGSVRNDAAADRRGDQNRPRAAAGPVDAADPGPAVAGDDDQRGAAGVRAADPVPAPELQRR